MDALLGIEAGVTSIRCLNRLRLVRAAAGTTMGAEEFCARFDAAERALAPAAGLTGEMRDAQGLIEHFGGHQFPPARWSSANSSSASCSASAPPGSPSAIPARS